MGLSPNPSFPEKGANVYERKMAPNQPGGRGPLRFEEGVATDTDVPDDFQQGMGEGAPDPRRTNHNRGPWPEKSAAETTQERAHVGSASWIEAPSFLGEFAHGANPATSEQTYEQVDRSGGRYTRHNPTVVEG